MRDLMKAIVIGILASLFCSHLYFKQGDGAFRRKLDVELFPAFSFYGSVFIFDRLCERKMGAALA